MLNNPPMNPVSGRTLDALHDALDKVEKQRDGARVIIFGAGEKAFCAGGDLREEKDFGDPETARVPHARPQHAQPHRERQAR